MTTSLPRVYLHIGAPKTGTTYLQAVLWQNRAALRRDGLLYPAHSTQAHLHAALDLQADTVAPEHNISVPGSWPRLVEEIRGWHGSVVISHETLSTANREQIGRALADLAFAEVHLICTVRDLGRQIPAVWQEDVKNHHTLPFTTFVDELTRTEGRPHWLAGLFWRFQATGAVLGRWGASLPPERVHVVTVPPRGAEPGLLWQRCAGVLGLDADRYDTATYSANRSLGWAEAEVLRRINVALGTPRNRDESDTYARVVRDVIVDRVLAQRPDPVAPTVPPQHRDRVTQRAERIINTLKNAGYDITGDLSELLPDFDGDGPDSPPADVQYDAAIAVIAELVSRLGQPRAVPSLRQIVRDLSYRKPAVMRLRRWYWEAKIRLPARQAADTRGQTR